MHRIAEPELMNKPEQVEAYANANFELAHSSFIRLFQQTFINHTCLNNNLNITPLALDAGCGPADISRRFIRQYPHFRITGVDAAENMISTAQQMNIDNSVDSNIQLICQPINQHTVTNDPYDVFISNSLLHHLQQPLQLWNLINRCCTKGSLIFVMDLLRPYSELQAQDFVNTYAASEPELLQQDFYHSLCAAYELDEVKEQLRKSNLDYLTVARCSDRHFIASGIVQ